MRVAEREKTAVRVRLARSLCTLLHAARRRSAREARNGGVRATAKQEKRRQTHTPTPSSLSLHFSFFLAPPRTAGYRRTNPCKPVGRSHPTLPLSLNTPHTCSDKTKTRAKRKGPPSLLSLITPDGRLAPTQCVPAGRAARPPPRPAPGAGRGRGRPGRSAPPPPPTRAGRRPGGRPAAPRPAPPHAAPHAKPAGGPRVQAGGRGQPVHGRAVLPEGRQGGGEQGGRQGGVRGRVRVGRGRRARAQAGVAGGRGSSGGGQGRGRAHDPGAGRALGQPPRDEPLARGHPAKVLDAPDVDVEEAVGGGGGQGGVQLLGAGPVR